MLHVNPLKVIQRYGLWGALTKAAKVLPKLAFEEIQHAYCLLKHRHVRQFQDPTPDELLTIERDLKSQKVHVSDVRVDIVDFGVFKDLIPFPDDYHGGIHGGVWDEKILEHYIAYKLLALEDFSKEDIYIDVAAGSSPWAKLLRDKLRIQAFALDRELSEQYKNLHYYKFEDATSTSFKDSSVKGMSLHCAFEMFKGDDDLNLIREMGRVLQPRGKALIVPLYLHTDYCSFSSPKYWGKGYSDQKAIECIRWDMRAIPSARFYDAAKLQERILQNVKGMGMNYRVYALRNKMDISPSVYCHFILEITK